MLHHEHKIIVSESIFAPVKRFVVVHRRSLLFYDFISLHLLDHHELTFRLICILPLNLPSIDHMNWFVPWKIYLLNVS